MPGMQGIQLLAQHTDILATRPQIILGTKYIITKSRASTLAP